MENKEKNTSTKKQSMKKRASRALAFCLTVVMVLNVVVMPVNAFSLGGFFRKLSNAVTSTVNAVKKIVDTSDSKTVYSFSELNSFTCSLFAPKKITVKLGADIYVPSNRNISSALHDVDLNMNGHTIYSSNPNQTVYLSYGRQWKVWNGTIVQRVNNSSGVINISGGDATFENVTIRKSGSASRVTGLYATGILADPKITFKNVTFDGMTTGQNITYGARVVMNNSYIKNCQGDAISIYGNYRDRDANLEINGGAVKYFKGNGINAGNGSSVSLVNTYVTGGTTRNRYGVLVGKKAKVRMEGTTKVISNAGGNIGVYKGNPVTIASVGAANKYSFTVVDGLEGTNPTTVANLKNTFSGIIRNYPVYSDISRYMVVGNETNNGIMIQNPPAQCNVAIERAWTGGKALNTSKDENYATISVNGGAETTRDGAVVKYAAKVTLSTTNNDPGRYKFVGWRKYTNNAVGGTLISTNPICQVEVIDENVTYKAEYQYMQYKITTLSSGKGTVTGGGTYYVDDPVTLKAIASSGDGNKTYSFNKWNDGNTQVSRQIVVSKDETYTAMFKKTGQTTGTMYLNVKEITNSSQITSGSKLLLIYVGAVGNSQNNKLEASSGNVGTTGLPDYSAKLSSTGTTSSHGRTAATGISSNQIDGYGYGVTPYPTMVSVDVVKAGGGFDTCTAGYIEKYTFTRNGKNETCWLYWCNGGGVNAVGPYALYSYSAEKTFNMSDVKIQMKDGFKPSVSGDEIDKTKLNVYVYVGSTRYDLGGLKFVADDLDNKIDYSEGDKLINFELDGVPVDYNFPEAIINGTQYTKLSEAISAANGGSNKTIEIVGPGVDSIDVASPVNLEQGVTIKGYDEETVTSMVGSTIGVDKDGTVRLTKGELAVVPQNDKMTAVGVKDAYTKADKPIIVTTESGGKDSVITPQAEGTTLEIFPDNNPEHKVTIQGAGGAGRTYEFDNIPSYGGENVHIDKETQYTINILKPDLNIETAITTSKYNTGDTTISTGENEDEPIITSSKEGDKVKVGENTYVTGKNKDGEKTVYRVNPDQTKEPSVILEKGQLGIPENTTISVKDTIIKNTGYKDKEGNTVANPVQIGADGTIDIPDGAGVTINDMQIEVPKKTPMNGNTTVTLDNSGKPIINTSGNSEVKLVIDGEETIYKVGDYDCKLIIGEDGIPVIEDGELKLFPGQVIKDRLGNEYKCPEDATAGITIMTTPQVYDTDDDGNAVLGPDGEPILVGGGDMSFVIPKDQSILCKPQGSKSFLTFDNPGNEEGFFNLDPEKASQGIESDSELELAEGKQLNISTGTQNITVKAPESGNEGKIQVDGSTGNVMVSKAGDKVIIDGKTYIAKADDTVFRVDDVGVTLLSGEGVAQKGEPINIQGVAITNYSDNDDLTVSTKDSTIKTTGNTEFVIAAMGDADAKICFATGSGVHEYPIGVDGSITLPKGEKITRKSGTSNVNITAQGADITMKPLSKPLTDETTGDNAATSPVGGLLMEIPTGQEVTIGGKTYKETTVDNGRQGEDAFKLPMQLVLDEKGNVVLYSGSAELGTNADISLYDVDNNLVTFKNTSEGEQKVQVTNPGIVTMPDSGTSVSMGSGKNKVEFSTTKDDTQIAYTSEVCLLKRGGVELNPNEKILVGDMVVRNISKGNIDVSLEEKLNEDNTFAYSGVIEVPNGKEFELSSPGATTGIVYQSNVEGDGSAIFKINEDGNMELPSGGLAKLTDKTGKKTTVQAGGDGIETIPTPEGAMFAIPSGGHIVVDGLKYTNSSDDYLILSVNQNGDVVLVKGEATLSEGAIVYVKNEDNGLVPIKNIAQKQEDGSEHTLNVSYTGETQTTDEEGNVTETTYPDVNIKVPAEGSVSVGEHEYKAASADGVPVEISMNIEKGIGTSGNMPGERIILEKGTVDLGVDSSIAVNTNTTDSDSDKKVVTNIGSTQEADVLVGANAKVELSTGAEVLVDESTTIGLPETSGEDYKASLDLGSSDDSLKVALQTTDGNGTSGADKKVIINENTYTSAEDGENLSLILDSNKQVTLADNSQKVGLSDGASIVIGDTTVTGTNSKTIVVTETTSGTTKVPTVDIPAGGEANIKNPAKDQEIDINIKVPETEAETENQTFTVDADGKVSTELQENDVVVIGGVEYTGTGTGTIKVDGTTGELLEKPEGAPPSMTIDSTQFNKPDYQFKLSAGTSITVDNVVYQASNNSNIILMGNPSGNPIVKLESEGSTIVIGGKTYTAAKDNSLFFVDDTGKITLKDNGSADASSNSGLKLGGKETATVNGVKFTGKTQEDSYTVIYHKEGPCVSIADGSKVLVEMNPDTKIQVADKIAAEIKGKDGKTEIVTTSGIIPVTMKDGKGSIYLDKTKEDALDSAYIQFPGAKNVEVKYSVDNEENKVIQEIIVTQVKSIPITPELGGGESTDAEVEKNEQQNPNVSIAGDITEQKLEIPVVVEDEKIIVETITKDVVEQLINSETQGTKVVSLDCSSLERATVVLDIPTVENMSEKADEIKIITASAEIKLDKQATNAILDQAKGDSIEVKVSLEEIDNLNEPQKETLDKYDVSLCISATVESAGIRIHDFKKGKVKISIPWEIEAGKKAMYYHVYYLDESGKMSIYDTVYEDKMLWFETEHFSEYVVVYDDDFLNATPVNDAPLMAKVTKVGKTSVKLEWKAVEGAKKYEVYVAKCNTGLKKYKLKKIATVDGSKSSYTVKKLKAGTKYKLMVKAIGKDGKLCNSLLLHVATKGGKYSNASGITVKQKSFTLKVGKTKTMKVSYKSNLKSVKCAKAVRYATSNGEIATVSEKGKISAKRAGSCYVYAILNSGEYAFVKITVK